MIEPNNGQALSPKDNRLLAPKGSQARYTAETVLRTRPKTYRVIVRLLAEPDARVDHIAKLHRVSEHTVRAIRAREAVVIAERKQRLVSIFGNVAEIAGERMEELAGKASLRDAGTTAGIATDKMLALTGQLSGPQIAIINMPSEQDREAQRATDAKLDAIARRLADTPRPTE